MPLSPHHPAPHHVSGPPPLPASATGSREDRVRPGPQVNVSSQPRPPSATSDKTKKTSRELPEKTKPAPGDKPSDAAKKLTGQDKYARHTLFVLIASFLSFPLGIEWAR